MRAAPRLRLTALKETSNSGWVILRVGERAFGVAMENKAMLYSPNVNEPPLVRLPAVWDCCLAGLRVEGRGSPRTKDWL
jgi:hypothetical protein